MQLWVFLIFPTVGAVLAGLIFRPLLEGVQEAKSAPFEEL